jgi:hypothetical protein
VRALWSFAVSQCHTQMARVDGHLIDLIPRDKRDQIKLVRQSEDVERRGWAEIISKCQDAFNSWDNQQVGAFETAHRGVVE